MAKETYTKEERQAQFLKAGIKLAKKRTVAKLTAAAVAAECKVTAPLVFHVFGTRENLQKAVLKEAKRQGVDVGTLGAPKKAAPKKKPLTKTAAKKAAKKAIARKVLKEYTKKTGKNIPPASAPAAKKTSPAASKMATLPVPSNVADQPLAPAI